MQPLGRGGCVADGGFRLFEVGQDALAARMECTPGLGQCKAPRGAVEQACTKRFFERLDVFRRHGARQAEFGGGGRERARIDDGDKGFERNETVHGSP